jgi:hypothetical protein
VPSVYNSSKRRKVAASVSQGVAPIVLGNGEDDEDDVLFLTGKKQQQQQQQQRTNSTSQSSHGIDELPEFDDILSEVSSLIEQSQSSEAQVISDDEDSQWLSQSLSQPSEIIDRSPARVSSSSDNSQNNAIQRTSAKAPLVVPTAVVDVIDSDSSEQDDSIAIVASCVTTAAAETITPVDEDEAAELLAQDGGGGGGGFLLDDDDEDGEQEFTGGGGFVVDDDEDQVEQAVDAEVIDADDDDEDQVEQAVDAEVIDADDEHSAAVDVEQVQTEPSQALEQHDATYDVDANPDSAHTVAELQVVEIDDADATMTVDDMVAQQHELQHASTPTASTSAPTSARSSPSPSVVARNRALEEINQELVAEAAELLQHAQKNQRQLHVCTTAVHLGRYAAQYQPCLRLVV